MADKITEIRAAIEVYIPAVVIDALLLCVILVICSLFIKYNLKLLAFITRTAQKIEQLFVRIFGKFAKNANKTMYRAATINNNKTISRVYNYLDSMLTDLDLHRDGVTVFGLLFFLSVISLLFTVILSTLFNLGALSILAFLAVFYVVFTMFKLVVGSQIAHREALIMDAIDLLVADIRDGVYNAIVRYKDNGINPEIAGYFHEFVNNITQNGWTFQQAMQELNVSLGTTFTDFATKAMIYEANQDEDTLEIFSATVDMNANKRMLREENDQIFAQVRLTFVLCLVLIVGSAVLFCLLDQAVAAVFVHSMIGRVLIVIDVFIVAFTLARIADLQNSKF